jgi:Na+-driven multidrug efflux pump
MSTLISKFQVLKKKEENKELVKHSFVSLLVRIGGAAAAFFMNVVACRYLGAEQAGYFFLAVTVSTLIATIGRVGADQTILRFVSVFGEQKQWNRVHAAIRKIIGWSSILLISLTTLICVFSRQISCILFHKPELQWPLFWCALSIPFFAIYNVHGMALQGRKKSFIVCNQLKDPNAFIPHAADGCLYTKGSSSASIYYLVGLFPERGVSSLLVAEKCAASDSKRRF